MAYAFHLDPLTKLKPAKDSSIAIMRALDAAGHEVFAIEPGGVWSDPRQGIVAEVKPLELSPHHQAQDWYRAGPAQVRPLTSFKAVFERKDPPFDIEYVHRTYLFEQAEAEGARIWNRPRAIRDHNEKLALLRHADLTPPTLVTSRADRLREFVNTHQDTIFKPLDGMGGSGIFRVRAGDANLAVIIETLTDYGHRMIMAQRYLPAIVEGDKRILIVAGEVVPYALARIPPPGETRGNMAAGGRPEARPLTASDRRIAETLAERLWPLGLFLIGIDVIGDCLTEINVTSPTGLVEIHAQTGFDVAQMVVEKLEAG